MIDNPIEVEQPAITLFAECLFSKFGFQDGDIIGEWLLDCDQIDWMEYSKLDEHAVLVSLVKAHLLPLLDQHGFQYSVGVIETIHNPIRIKTWGSEDWDDYAEAPAVVRDLGVDVPLLSVLADLKSDPT